MKKFKLKDLNKEVDVTLQRNYYYIKLSKMTTMATMEIFPHRRNTRLMKTKNNNFMLKWAQTRHVSFCFSFGAKK